MTPYALAALIAFTFAWPAAVVAFGFSTMLGVVFGLYPAIRAARLEPTEALRAESPAMQWTLAKATCERSA